MFDLNSFGAAGKRLNAEFLTSLPGMRAKVTIVGGGVKTFDDKEKGGQQSVPYLLVTSASFEGEKELSLNAGNRNILGATYGKQAGAWVGKTIGVYFDPTVSYAGKAIGGIKVDPLAPKPSFDDVPSPPPAVPAPSADSDSIPF